MNLDERAERAARDLSRRATHDLDLVQARAAVAHAASARRGQLRRLRLGGAAIAVLAVVGALVAVSGQRPDGDVTRSGDLQAVEDYDTSVDPASAAAVLGAMPTSPIDGKQSWRLPVLAKPQSGLADGDVVTVYGRGFGADEYLGVVMCSSEADTANEGVGACQLALGPDDSFGAVTYATASSEGNVAVDVTVRRFITTPNGGEIDCLSAAERCLIGMGAVSNYDKSGGTYVNFAGAPAFAEPSLVVEPGGPVTPGQQVVARFAGLVPLRAIRVQQCLEDRCQNLVDGAADAAGTAALTVAPQPSIVDAETGDVLACEGRCVLRGTGIGVEGASSQPFPADVALTFTAEEPSAPVTTAPPTTAPDPGSGAVPPGTAPPKPATDPTNPATTAPAGSVTTVPATTAPPETVPPTTTLEIPAGS